MSPKNKMKKEQTPEFKKILDRIKSKKSRAKDEKGQNEMMKNDGDENENTKDEILEDENRTIDVNGACTVNKVSTIKSAFEKMVSDENKTNKTTKTEVKSVSKNKKQQLNSKD